VIQLTGTPGIIAGFFVSSDPDKGRRDERARLASDIAQQISILEAGAATWLKDQAAALALFKRVQSS